MARGDAYSMALPRSVELAGRQHSSWRVFPGSPTISVSSSSGRAWRRSFVSAFAFGDSAALARELAVLVRVGQKRATASLPVEFTAGGDPLPAVGDVEIVTLADGEPVCIIETTEVRLIAFGEVDAAFAAGEGEGNGSLYPGP